MDEEPSAPTPGHDDAKVVATTNTGKAATTNTASRLAPLRSTPIDTIMRNKMNQTNAANKRGAGHLEPGTNTPKTVSLSKVVLPSATIPTKTVSQPSSFPRATNPPKAATPNPTKTTTPTTNTSEAPTPLATGNSKKVKTKRKRWTSVEEAPNENAAGNAELNVNKSEEMNVLQEEDGPTTASTQRSVIPEEVTTPAIPARKTRRTRRGRIATVVPSSDDEEQEDDDEASEIANVKPAKPLIGSYDDDWEFILVRVEIEDVIQPPHAIRETDEAEVQKYTDWFVLDGYGKGSNYIHISLRDIEEDIMRDLIAKLKGKHNTYTKGLWDYLESNHSKLRESLKDDPLLYVDGGHRGAALKKPEVRARPGCNYPLARLYYKRNFAKVTGLDIQCLGSGENAIASTVTPMTDDDKIHNTVSFLRNIYAAGDNLPFKLPEQLKSWKSFKETESFKEKVECLGSLCYGSNINVSAENTDMAKFCTIAVGIYIIAKPEGLENEELSKSEVDNLEKEHKDNEQVLLGLLKKSDKLDVKGATTLWTPKTMETQKWLIKKPRRSTKYVRSISTSFG